MHRRPVRRKRPTWQRIPLGIGKFIAIVVVGLLAGAAAAVTPFIVPILGGLIVGYPVMLLLGVLHAETGWACNLSYVACFALIAVVIIARRVLLPRRTQTAAVAK